jgi:hypothetical protein
MDVVSRLTVSDTITTTSKRRVITDNGDVGLLSQPAASAPISASASATTVSFRKDQPATEPLKNSQIVFQDDRAKPVRPRRATLQDTAIPSAHRVGEPQDKTFDHLSSTRNPGVNPLEAYVQMVPTLVENQNGMTI